MSSTALVLVANQDVGRFRIAASLWDNNGHATTGRVKQTNQLRPALKHRVTLQRTCDIGTPFCVAYHHLDFNNHSVCTISHLALVLRDPIASHVNSKGDAQGSSRCIIFAPPINRKSLPPLCPPSASFSRQFCYVQASSLALYTGYMSVTSWNGAHSANKFQCQ